MIDEEMGDGCVWNLCFERKGERKQIFYFKNWANFDFDFESDLRVK